MKKIIGVVLIIIAIGLGYQGVNTVSNSGQSTEVLGVELGVEDKSQKTTGFIYLGLAVVSLIGGVTLVGKK